jgi:hypothetical protein
LLFFFSSWLLIGSFFFLLRQGRAWQKQVETAAEAGYGHLNLAVAEVKQEDFDSALLHFDSALSGFFHSGKKPDLLGRSSRRWRAFSPGLSKISSGKNAIVAGKHFAAAGIPLSQVALSAKFSQRRSSQGEKVSWLDFLATLKTPLATSRQELTLAQKALNKIELADIPAAKQKKFLSVREETPIVLGLLQSFEEHEALLEELLGGNGPRKYLFLLENNQELRATGGFIGTYALLEVNDGVLRRFFVDGIFNPDGQLKENIVPPQPIQKISAAWSLHDSNWFPDFPTSAEKAISFYEKTGGPTVDGVITLTPTIMQKLLQVVGPITLPQYGLTVDADNFIPVIQEQVEVKYDRVENQPKKILADLSGVLMEKVFAAQDKASLGQVAEALVEGLNEKQALLYMRHKEAQTLIEKVGWSGRMLDTPKDYLSVVHSNINGYKTDGVIDEVIKHQAEIQGRRFCHRYSDYYTYASRWSHRV